MTDTSVVIGIDVAAVRPSTAVALRAGRQAGRGGHAARAPTATVIEWMEADHRRRDQVVALMAWIERHAPAVVGGRRPAGLQKGWGGGRQARRPGGACAPVGVVRNALATVSFFPVASGFIRSPRKRPSCRVKPACPTGWAPASTTSGACAAPVLRSPLRRSCRAARRTAGGHRGLPVRRVRRPARRSAAKQDHPRRPTAPGGDAAARRSRVGRVLRPRLAGRFGRSPDREPFSAGPRDPLRRSAGRLDLAARALLGHTRLLRSLVILRPRRSPSAGRPVW